MASSAVLDGQDPSGEAPDLRELKAEGVRLRSELAAARESEARLREQLARGIETQQRLVARLAGGMAHDFNNLLTIIAGYAMLLHEDNETPAAARERLSEILRASNCAKDLTHKLLVLSRKQPAQPRVIEVDRFLRTQAIKPLEELAGPRVTLAIQLSARDTTIRIDPAELMQMLSTLVLNARDAMPAGGALTIASTVEEHVSGPTPRARKAGAHVRVSVTDTGAGMDDAVQAQLFEPFFTTKRLGTGSGLGLAILKGLVEHSGGFVDVHSSPSLGTTMTLWFPVATQP
jgi:signal transduction histidine kinase